MEVLNEADARRLRTARRVAHLPDKAVEIRVVRHRVGFDAIAGPVPVAGDALAAAKLDLRNVRLLERELARRG